jgi:esterase/lipase superfamily enzyme
MVSFNFLRTYEETFKKIETHRVYKERYVKNRVLIK